MSKEEIKKAVGEAVRLMENGYCIQRVRLFGSQLSGEAREDSDVDLLIDFDDNAPIGLFELVRIKDSLKKSLGKEVDIGTPEELSVYIKEEVVRRAETLYER